jgi:type IV secretory pathway VirB4 component
MDISMFFYPVKSEIILKQLKNKVGALEAQINADADKGAPRDPLRETALRDVEQLRDNLTQGVEHFFQFAFYVTVYAESKERLDQISEDIEGIFGAKLISSRKVLFQGEQGFNSTLPLCNDELMISFNMNSSPIAASFPFISAELSSDDGILYGINRHNNSLILFDRFSLQNANMVVFATSGAGKSYAIKLEILRRLHGPYCLRRFDNQAIHQYLFFLLPQLVRDPYLHL